MIVLKKKKPLQTPWKIVNLIPTSTRWWKHQKSGGYTRFWFNLFPPFKFRVSNSPLERFLKRMSRAVWRYILFIRNSKISKSYIEKKIWIPFQTQIVSKCATWIKDNHKHNYHCHFAIVLRNLRLVMWKYQNIIPTTSLTFQCQNYTKNGIFCIHKSWTKINPELPLTLLKVSTLMFLTEISSKNGFW